MCIQSIIRKERKHALLFVSVWLLLLLSSCAAEPLLDTPSATVGKTVSISLKYRVANFDHSTHTTRTASGQSATDPSRFSVSTQMIGQSVPSTRTDEPMELYNLWFFQFDANGNRQMVQKVSSKTVSVNEYDYLDVNLIVGTNQTLFIALLGREYEQNLSNITTITQLRALYFPVFKSENGELVPVVTTDSEIPMQGLVEGVNVRESTDTPGKGVIEYDVPERFFGGIDLIRSMAKVTFKMKFSVTSHTLKALEMHNIPASFTLLPTTDPTTAALQKLYIGTLPAADAEGYHTFTWYLPTNYQGDVSTIFNESDRYHKYYLNSSLGNAPKNGTWVQAWSVDNGNSDYYNSYQIYLGKNNTSNFDVAANSHYLYTTDINIPYIATGENDNRINGVAATNKVEGYASSIFAKTGNEEVSSGKTGVNYDFDCHYDSRFLYVEAVGRSVEVYISDADGNAYPGAHPWLKVSSLANYTDAYNAGDLGNAASAHLLVVPSRMRFTLFADEYIDHTATDKRTVYVTVKTTAINSSSTVKSNVVFRYDQRPINLVGHMGGGFNHEKGQFNTFLGMDQINESTRHYEIPNLPDETSSSPPFGYDGVDLVKGNDYYYGKRQTKEYAENLSNFTVNSGISNKVEQTQLINGKPNLYQYNYYNTFAARYCYDRNRDENGNGEIDADEMKWYVPANSQVLLMYVTKTGINSGSIRTINSFTAANAFSFNLSIGSSNASYDKKQPAPLRCVRDIDIPNATWNQATVEAGNPIITTHLDANGVNRFTQSPSIYYSKPLWSYVASGTSSVDLNQNVNRIVRHTVEGTTEVAGVNPNDKVSVKFRVAKNYTTYEYPASWNSRWAYLNGWDYNFNGYSDLYVGTNAVPTGCSQYYENSESEKGSWRMPTQRELILMGIFQTNSAYSAVSYTPMVGDLMSASERLNEGKSTSAGGVSLYSNNHVFIQILQKDYLAKARCILDIP